MRRNIIKRMAAGLVTVAMASTLLTGCGNSKKDLIQLDVVSTRANFAGIQGGWMGEVFADKFGAQLNIIKGDETTLTIMTGQGDLGDLIVWGAGGATYQDCADQGMLTDWESGELLEKFGPYIKENLTADMENMKKYVPDNKVYGICGDVSPTADGIDTFFYSWDIRWDLYEKVGKPQIKNLDDLYDLFVAMKKAYPTNDAGQETYALSLWSDWDGDMVMYVKCLCQAFYGLEGDYVPGLYDNKNGQFYDILKDDGYYLEMVRFLNKLYQAGLVDPDSNTQTYDEALKKLKNDRVFFSIFDYAGSTAYNTNDHLAEGKAMFSLVPTEANNIVYALSETGVSSMCFSIGAKSEYPDVVMNIINWMYTPEGRLTTEYGPEKLCWYIGEDGLTYFTPLGAALHNDTALEFGNLYSFVGADGIEHIVSESAVSNKTYTDETGTYDVTLYYELPKEFENYRGMAFQNGTNEMNIVSWNLNSINPLTGERYNCDYWESVNAAKATSDIEQQWRDWASAQAGYEVFNKENYLQSTDYDIVLSVHDKSDTMDTDMKVVYKQMTGTKDGIICTGSWNAILSADDAECEGYISKMRGSIMAFGAGGNSFGYKDIVAWCQEQCDIRYAEEQNFISAHPGVFDR